MKIGTTLDNSDVTTWLYLETHESRNQNSLSESAKDALFVFKVTSVNIAKTILIVTAPSLRLISQLEKTGNELVRTHKRVVQQLDTRRLIRRRTNERFNHQLDGKPGWDAPIYNN